MASACTRCSAETIDKKAVQTQIERLVGFVSLRIDCTAPCCVNNAHPLLLAPEQAGLDRLLVIHAWQDLHLTLALSRVRRTPRD